MSQKFFNPYTRGKSKEVESNRMMTKEESQLSENQDNTVTGPANVSLPWQSNSKMRHSASDNLKALGLTTMAKNDRSPKKPAFFGAFGGLFTKIVKKQGGEPPVSFLDKPMSSSKSNSILRPKIKDCPILDGRQDLKRPRAA